MKKIKQNKQAQRQIEDDSDDCAQISSFTK